MKKEKKDIVDEIKQIKNEAHKLPSSKQPTVMNLRNSVQDPEMQKMLKNRSTP